MKESEELNGVVVDFEQRRSAIRETLLGAVNDITSRVLDEFILPHEREQILQDVAMFVPFLMAVKTTEERRQEIDKKFLLAAWWPIEKRIKREVPEQLLMLHRARVAGEVG